MQREEGKFKNELKRIGTKDPVIARALAKNIVRGVGCQARTATARPPKLTPVTMDPPAAGARAQGFHANVNDPRSDQLGVDAAAGAVLCVRVCGLHSDAQPCATRVSTAPV